MPRERVMQLTDALLSLDGNWIVRLLEQIPSEHQRMRDASASLAKQFRYDVLLDLLDTNS